MRANVFSRFAERVAGDVGVFRSGRFYLDANGSRSWNTGDVSFGFGTTDDKPISGDWNGDGITDVGIVRSGKFYLDANGSRSWNAGDVSFAFGNAGDDPRLVFSHFKAPLGEIGVAHTPVLRRVGAARHKRFLCRLRQTQPKIR